IGLSSGRDGIWYPVPIPPGSTPMALSRSAPGIDDDLGGRTEHSMIFDPVAGRFIVFGGITLQSGPDHNDVWERPLDGSGVWVAMSPLGTPPTPRYGHSAIYDPVRRRIIVFGGHSIADNDALWQLTLDDPPTWSPLATTGSLPVSRYG